MSLVIGHLEHRLASCERFECRICIIQVCLFGYQRLGLLYAVETTMFGATLVYATLLYTHI